MEDGNPFSAWLELQLELQRDVFVDPRIFSEDEEGRADFLIWNAFAATDELHEAMQEVGWKPWASSRHLNSEEFLEEIVDALHFIGNMVLAASINRHEDPKVLAVMLWQKYQQKAEKNMQRQLLGYDGVTGKCPVCKREMLEIYNDSGVVAYNCPQHGRVESGQSVQST